MNKDRIAIVSGSGFDLRPLLDEVIEEHPFHAFPGLGGVTIAGHQGVFVLGRHAGREVILQCGRRHAYEGLSMDALGRTVDALAELGAGMAVFTNAAGGIFPETEPGTLVAVETVWTWPYRRENMPPVLHPSTVLTGCDTRGAYVWTHGPCYETQAEARLLAQWGAATVGMSTAPEMMRCAAAGLRTAVVSCVTNHCLRPQKLTHDHVLRIAKRSSKRLCALLANNLSGRMDI